MPALVVTLGSVPMADELPVARNGVASLGSLFVDYYSPHPSPSSQACADRSIAPVSESSVEFHLFIELVSVESPLWSMLSRRWPSRVLLLCWRGISAIFGISSSSWFHLDYWRCGTIGSFVLVGLLSRVRELPSCAVPFGSSGLGGSLSQELSLVSRVQELLVLHWDPPRCGVSAQKHQPHECES